MEVMLIKIGVRSTVFQDLSWVHDCVLSDLLSTDTKKRNWTLWVLTSLLDLGALYHNLSYTHWNLIYLEEN